MVVAGASVACLRALVEGAAVLEVGILLAGDSAVLEGTDREEEVVLQASM